MEQITHACGHIQERELLYGNSSIQFYKHRLCDECYGKEKDALLSFLPKLEGSDRQIKYGNDCRLRCIVLLKEIVEYISNIKPTTERPSDSYILMYNIVHEKKPSFWIKMNNSNGLRNYMLLNRDGENTEKTFLKYFLSKD